MSSDSMLLEDDGFTSSCFLRPRKAQPQSYGFDFSAGEDDSDDPERLALDDAESVDDDSRQESMQPLPPFATAQPGVHGIITKPVEVDDDDDDASAYAPSQPGSPLSTPSSEPRTLSNLIAVSSPRSYSNNRRTPKGRKVSANVEDEDDEEFGSGRASQSGPSRRKATGKGKKKSENHIKRPPNAFILYRSHACSNNLIPAELKINDHRQISRIVATMWRSLPAEERAIWEAKAREAKEKHNQEHPEYRYKPSSKPSAQRKPRPRKPPIADEDLTEEQLRERRRCEVVARVILQKDKESTPGPVESNVAVASSSQTRDSTPQPAGNLSPDSAPPVDDIKARLAKEMKKAVEEDRVRRELEDEQRKLGILPPRPTETLKARRQRAATVAPVRGHLDQPRSHLSRARAPSAPPIPSPVRTMSYGDLNHEPTPYELQELLRPDFQHHHHQRASSWSGFPGSEAYASDYGHHRYEAEQYHLPYRADSQYDSYSGIEAQWDIRRPSVIFKDQAGSAYPDRETSRYAPEPEDHFDETAYVDQEGQVHSGLTTQQVVDATDLAVFPSPPPPGDSASTEAVALPEHELMYRAGDLSVSDRLFGRRDSTSQWYEQTTPTAPNHDWRRATGIPTL